MKPPRSTSSCTASSAAIRIAASRSSPKPWVNQCVGRLQDRRRDRQPALDRQPQAHVERRLDGRAADLAVALGEVRIADEEPGALVRTPGSARSRRARSASCRRCRRTRRAGCCCGGRAPPAPRPSRRGAGAPATSTGRPNGRRPRLRRAGRRTPGTVVRRAARRSRTRTAGAPSAGTRPWRRVEPVDRDPLLGERVVEQAPVGGAVRPVRQPRRHLQDLDDERVAGRARRRRRSGRS